MKRQNQLLSSISILFLGGILCVASSRMQTANAFNLSDLVHQHAQLFLPSQIIPGQTSIFSIKGKPGQSVELILSDDGQGSQAPNGQPLHVGKPTLTQTGLIPESGVLNMSVKIPNNPDKLGDQQFVDAYTFSAGDQSDAQEADIIDHTGVPAVQNMVTVGTPPAKTGITIIPGDASMSDVMRSLNTMSEVGGDPRKQQLLDNGTINRQREIDQNLSTPSSP